MFLYVPSESSENTQIRLEFPVFSLIFILSEGTRLAHHTKSQFSLIIQGVLGFFISPCVSKVSHINLSYKIKKSQPVYATSWDLSFYIWAIKKTHRGTLYESRMIRKKRGGFVFGCSMQPPDTDTRTICITW